MKMSIGETTQVQPVRRRRLRITVFGMLVLVAAIAVVLVFYRRHLSRTDPRPAIAATFKKVSPVADGTIGKNEYGVPVTITWNENNTLAAFHHDLLDPTTNKFFEDPTGSKQPVDLSVEFFAAYTDKSLSLAFRVHDQFVDAQIEEERPELDDGVEVFIDGDGVPNDFVVVDMTNGNRVGSKEGFQIGGNAAGQRFTKSEDFTDADWKSMATRTNDGYIVEMEIPLALIDTKDGPPFAPAGPGSLLNLGFAVVDNDAEVHKQMSYAYLRTANQTMSPYMGGESAWNFAIKLEPQWSLWPW
jgi:hypothetical protein